MAPKAAAKSGPQEEADNQASDGADTKKDEHAPQNILESYGYEAKHTLASGSYAVVKEGYSASKQCKVAIKIVQKKKAPKDYIEKFLPREIKIIKDLHHQHMVCFKELIETSNRVYIIMELAERGDLLDVMNRRKYVDEGQAGVWFGQMVDCIAYIHSKGIVHRDLKCENVLLDSKNNIKVTDFGFARSGLIRADGSIAFSQTYCGSYSYAAPEILTGTPYNPFKSDIWSLGVILFIMVFGRFPFDDTTHKTLLKQVQSEVKFPSDRTWVSEDCKALLRKIFQRPDARITFEDMRKDPWYRRSCVSKKE